MSSPKLEEKMHAALNGDDEAYTYVLKTIEQRLRGYLSPKLGFAEVEDVIQETLLAVHKARHTYDAAKPLMPWVYAIAKFKLNDYFRKHYKDVMRDSADFHEMEQQLLVEDVTSQYGTNEELTKALEVLPEKQRQIILLMKVEGYTAREVGEKLGMRTSAVKVSAHRAYKKLKGVMHG